MVSKRHLRCPKCGGKVLIDKDYHGWYEECLQCGYTCDLEVLVEPKAWIPQPQQAMIAGQKK